MPNPSPPSGHPQGDDMRLNEARSSNAHGSCNAHRCNQTRCQGASCSLYEGKQAKIKDHVYDVGEFEEEMTYLTRPHVRLRIL